MYIGTNLSEKSGVYQVIDTLDFTFGISSMSIPYLDKYGVDFSKDIDEEALRLILERTLSKLDISVTLDKLVVDSNSRSVNMVLNYQGNAIEKSINI